ncbi:MAG TPA: ATP-binding protein [Burkholderiales bacterium]|nr:ATP-binding protein [Burkholderiales bacterium]
MNPKALRFKVSVYPALALLAALVLFSVLLVRHQRNEIRAEAVRHVNQLSEVLIRSTRYAMLQNQPEYVHRIIQDVARQNNIAKVRIFSKEGVIIDSTYQPELGMKVDRKAEGCFHCHQTDKPVQQVPLSERARMFVTPGGKHMLASMEVIRNEPTCYNSACHVHSSAQSVLGVLDIVYSIDEIDSATQRSVVVIIALLLGLVGVASLLMSLLVHRLIYVPLRDLESGAKRVAEGNLDQAIPVRGDDELGQLASSFNSMTAALKESGRELREWNRTLEQKVAERTRELRQAEAETVRGEKLASVGLLAAGVAHELNNPLTGILTFSSLIRKKLPDGSPDAEDLDLVIKETKRSAAIIRRLLDFAREKAPEKKFTDLNRLIEDTARIVESPAQLHDIRIDLDLDRTLPPIWLDANMIEQVVMNMLVNARQAIEQEGRITVRTRRAPQPMSSEPGATPVPMAEISIIDTGCGIAESDMKHIFDPFFSSKEVGEGTGLGLSVSHGIVRAHGGLIEVQSRVGEGSTFRVYLPLEAAGAEVDKGSGS